jgi:sister chromatid cohesion protein PDS5
VEHLKLIRQALWFVLEPLMLKNEHYSFGFYQELIQKMKNRRDAVSPEDEALNSKMYAICDLAMGIIVTRWVKKKSQSIVPQW